MSARRPPRIIATTDQVREIRCVARNGRRFAFYRFRGSRSLYWRSLPVPLAERALRAGSGTFDGFTGPCAAYVRPATAETTRCATCGRALAFDGVDADSTCFDCWEAAEAVA